MTDETEDTLPPARRATDLPSDAPWWARYIEANAKEAWRWASMQWGAFVFVAAEVYAADPVGVQAHVKEMVPAAWWPHIIAGASLAAMVLRVVNIRAKKA